VILLNQVEDCRRMNEIFSRFWFDEDIW